MVILAAPWLDFQKEEADSGVSHLSDPDSPLSRFVTGSDPDTFEFSTEQLTALEECLRLSRAAQLKGGRF